MRVWLFEYICHCCSASWLMAACLFLNDGCEENFSEVTVNSFILLLWQKRGKKTRDVLLRYLCWPAVIAFYLPPFESVAFRSNRRRFKLSFPQESHHSCSLTSRWNQSWQATSKRCQKWRCRRKSWIHHSLGKIWAHTSFLLSESRNQRKASGGKKGKLVLLHQNVTTITGNLLHSIYTNS